MDIVSEKSKIDSASRPALPGVGSGRGPPESEQSKQPKQSKQFNSSTAKGTNSMPRCLHCASSVLRLFFSVAAVQAAAVAS
jgi:hypothetical protein